MQTVVTRLLNSRFLGKFSSITTGDGLSAQWQIFGEVPYDWSVMSSITGPSFGSDLPRMTLPMEVVTVSTYTSPVVSSLTMWLELTLEMLGVVTNDDPPYLRIDIPPPAPVEQTHADPPLGRMHTTPAVSMLKTPWKPRISLIDEVTSMLDRGMTEDYDHEPEHSAVARSLAPKWMPLCHNSWRHQHGHWTLPLREVL